MLLGAASTQTPAKPTAIAMPMKLNPSGTYIEPINKAADTTTALPTNQTFGLRILSIPK